MSGGNVAAQDRSGPFVPGHPVTGQVHMSRLAQMAVAITNDAIFALDHDWGFSFVSDAAEILLRRPRMGLLGTDLWAAFPDLRESTFGTHYEEAAASRRPVTFEG